MKYKVVILEQDQNYLDRLLVALHEKVSDVMDVIPCYNPSEILKFIELHKPDLFIINERIEFDLSEIPEDCAIVCFTEFRTADKVKNKPAVCKYQKVKDISSQLLEITENYKEVLKVNREEEQKAKAERIAARRRNPEVLVFFSAQEGNGSATAAAACAINAAERGLYILSLNIRPLKHMNDIFTKSVKDKNLSELIELANREELAAERLEQQIATDESGVDYLDSGSEDVAMAALEKKGFLHILSRIGETAKYDAIVLNIDSSLNAITMEALKSAAKIVVVGNGTAESNAGIEAYLNGLKKYDELNQTSVTEHISILYNKFINRKCTMLSIPGVNVIGGVNHLDGINPGMISVNMAKMMIFQSLISE